MNRWAPFNAVCDGNTLIDDILYNKSNKNKPLLSEDQLELLQEKIVESMTTKTNITIKYFNNGFFYSLNIKIKKIDNITKKIFFEDGNWLYLNQIIDAS